MDSAEYYLNKTFPLLNNHHIEEKAMVLNTFGDLYTAKKDYKKALDYYHQVLNVYTKMNRKRSILSTYKCISHVYDLSGDSVNENEYLKKYTLLHDSIEIDERKTYNNIVEKIVSENEAEDGKNKNFFFIAIAILAAISGVIIYFVSKAYAKKHKLKDKIISEKETETDELKKKLNTAFDEINQLAKSRDPLFLARFKEVYPEFFEKLTAKNPDLTEHDIKFAAYIRLNLTNKDIVQFENTTLRAIEMKKYRLKKKFDLSSDIDFNKWILEL
ncbi:helix-turn-helix transcriptional regulator [Chryseobacterium sp. MMS23-Vi53]|uniref:helix-turn-helix transcriptional regulator n=1 Tax=Chryseobacterium sp. MMS23-Vi53 TaxID=3386644 RepID=UPI0039EC4246